MHLHRQRDRGVCSCVASCSYPGQIFHAAVCCLLFAHSGCTLQGDKGLQQWPAILRTISFQLWLHYFGGGQPLAGTEQVDRPGKSMYSCYIQSRPSQPAKLTESEVRFSASPTSEHMLRIERLFSNCYRSKKSKGLDELVPRT